MIRETLKTATIPYDQDQLPPPKWRDGIYFLMWMKSMKEAQLEAQALGTQGKHLIILNKMRGVGDHFPGEKNSVKYWPYCSNMTHFHQVILRHIDWI